jgi:hypothetical protein
MERERYCVQTDSGGLLCPAISDTRRFDGISTLPNGDAWMVGTMRITKKGGPLLLIEHYSAC